MSDVNPSVNGKVPIVGESKKGENEPFTPFAINIIVSPVPGQDAKVEMEVMTDRSAGAPKFEQIFMAFHHLYKLMVRNGKGASKFAEFENFSNDILEKMKEVEDSYEFIAQIRESLKSK